MASQRSPYHVKIEENSRPRSFERHGTTYVVAPSTAEAGTLLMALIVEELDVQTEESNG